jgi:hypothetical protein
VLRLALPTYCCTHGIDPGNRVDSVRVRSEERVKTLDVIYQVSNLINYLVNYFVDS